MTPVYQGFKIGWLLCISAQELRAVAATAASMEAIVRYRMATGGKRMKDNPSQQQQSLS